MWSLRSTSVWKSEREQTFEKVGPRQRIARTSRITRISRISTSMDALFGFQLASKRPSRDTTIGKTLYEEFISRKFDVENTIDGNDVEGLDSITRISIFSFDLAFNFGVLYFIHHYMKYYLLKLLNRMILSIKSNDTVDEEDLDAVRKTMHFFQIFDHHVPKVFHLACHAWKEEKDVDDDEKNEEMEKHCVYEEKVDRWME